MGPETGVGCWQEPSWTLRVYRVDLHSATQTSPRQALSRTLPPPNPPCSAGSQRSWCLACQGSFMLPSHLQVDLTWRAGTSRCPDMKGRLPGNQGAADTTRLLCRLSTAEQLCGHLHGNCQQNPCCPAFLHSLLPPATVSQPPRVLSPSAALLSSSCGPVRIPGTFRASADVGAV